MAMFAQSLNTLKKRVSEVVKDAVAEGGLVHDLVGKQRREDAGGVALDELGPPSFEADSTFRQLAAPLGGGLPESPILVRYEVQNGDDSDREGAVFPLPPAASGITLGHLRSHFPVPGRFHFRFKAPSPDGSFGGMVWADLMADVDSVPIFRGEICLKALSIPDDADPMPVLQPISNGVLAAAAAAAAASGSPIGTPPQRYRRPNPARFTGAEGFADGQPVHAASAPAVFEPAARSSFAEPGSPVPVAGGQPAAEPAGRASRRPHGDGIRRTLARAGDGCGARARGDGVGGASTEGALAAETAAGGAGPREAEAGEEERAIQQVRDAAARQQEQLEKDEKLRADKVKSSNDIGTQLDEWAKTPDGQSFKDIKVLISTMHTALWPDSGWKELSLSELLGGPAAVKKWYRKAILVVHPDKQTEAPPDQQVRADRIFQALNEAFKISDDK
eukprot:CAMPEP_0177196122 /NCGR_PEP_ID=MMETSP0367-20130122/23877_1 /TAXON_ID=447022 ORGANISM="Scrippsiella hangoei-like, Strain SHHI-4" /NCGR_SAMPLE_ID=MMETSP0367 /ASSEMBLY_ACC=CAM_ASM_000362 /LENGTH=446 /DNA_ID=CAMNT_0018644193 /DNA_START=130 /DNA_END=1471 /DNA_ORIENTATION=-